MNADKHRFLIKTASKTLSYNKQKETALRSLFLLQEIASPPKNKGGSQRHQFMRCTVEISKHKEIIMAKVRNNIIIQGLSGSLGDQLVIKQDKAGRTIVGVAPSFDPNRTFTEAQTEQHDKFRNASIYAKGAKGEEVYAEKAEGTPLNPYNVAMADWFHAPEILELDVAAWHGEVGQVIRIQAVDDVKVTQVNVVITDSAGAVLEQGAAVQAEGAWWTYTTTATAGNASKVVVTARDLPGNIAEMNLD
jgi:hypothetical protein